MLAYIVRRLLQSILVLLAVGFIAFSLFNFVGDPINNMVGVEATDAERDRARAALGLDDPFPVQFAEKRASSRRRRSASCTSHAGRERTRQAHSHRRRFATFTGKSSAITPSPRAARYGSFDHTANRSPRSTTSVCATRCISTRAAFRPMRTFGVLVCFPTRARS